MNKAHLAIGVIGISVMLAAEPVCRRILLPPKHHSAATLKRWKEWNKTHVPPKQVLAELDLICPPVATLDAEAGGFLLPVDTPVWVDAEPEPLIAGMDVPDYEVPSVAVLTGDAMSNSTMEPPYSAPVPEPLSLTLLGTGIAAFVLVKLAEVRA